MGLEQEHPDILSGGVYVEDTGVEEISTEFNLLDREKLDSGAPSKHRGFLREICLAVIDVRDQVEALGCFRKGLEQAIPRDPSSRP